MLLFPAGMADGRHDRRAGARRHRARAPTSPRPGTPPTRRWPRSRFDGMQVRRDIGWRAPGAELRSYAAAGVDIDEGNRAVAQLEDGRRAHPRRRGRARHRQLRRRLLGQGPAGDGRPGARGVDRRRRHQGRARRPPRPGPRHRHGHRQPLRRRRPRAVGPAAVLPRLHRRRRRSTPTSWPTWSAGWPRRARPPGARCSAARRPRCPASTRRARSTSPARSSGWPSGPTCSPATTSAVGDVLDRRGLQRARTPTATRCCASCSPGSRWTSSRPAWTARSVTPCSSRTATTSTS